MNIEEVAIIVVAIFFIYLFLRQMKIKEHMNNTDNSIDIDAMKTLNNISLALLNTGVNIPGNMMVRGNCNLMPKGCIVAWSGATNKIPPTWALCDGKNGTPDLQNRFIFGADSTLTNVTDVSKLKEGTTQIPLSAANLPRHNHKNIDNSSTPTPTSTSKNNQVIYLSLPRGKGDNDKDNQASKFLGFGNSGVSRNFKFDVGNHSHAINANVCVNCAGAPVDIMPPFYKMCYIMKL